MYNCINEATKYLFDKYGITHITVDNVIGLLDKTIVLLVDQYYLSIRVKKELYELLISAEIISE